MAAAGGAFTLKYRLESKGKGDGPGPAAGKGKGGKKKSKAKGGKTASSTASEERRKKSAAEDEIGEDPMPITPSKVASAAAGTAGAGGSAKGKTGRRASVKPKGRKASSVGIEGVAQTGASTSSAKRGRKASTAKAPAPVTSPAPIKPPSRPDPDSQKAARKEREAARGGAGTGEDEKGAFGSVAQVVQHIETLKTSRLKKLNDSSMVVQDAGKKGVARIKLQAKALAETFTGHIQALSTAMPREAKAIFERARKCAGRVPTGPLGAKTFVDTATAQLDQMKQKEAALHAKAARGGKTGGAASTLLDRTHEEQTEASEAEKLPLPSIEAAVAFAQFRLKLRINQIMRAKRTLLTAYRRVRDATVAQAEAVGVVAAEGIRDIAGAEAPSLPAVAHRVRVATGLVRRRFSSARGRFLEVVSSGLAQPYEGGETSWTAAESQEGDPDADADNRPSWGDLRVRVCRLLHFAMNSARSLGVDVGSAGAASGAGAGADGGDQDEWVQLRRLVFLATQQDEKDVDTQAKKAADRHEALRQKMQKAKTEAAHAVSQAGVAGGVASAASKFKSKIAKAKKGKGGKDAAGAKGGVSSVGSEKASKAAAEAGAKGKAPSHAVELDASYFAFPSIAKMRRLRFQQGDAANAKKGKGAAAKGKGGKAADAGDADRLGFDVTADSPEAASWLVLGSQQLDGDAIRSCFWRELASSGGRARLASEDEDRKLGDDDEEDGASEGEEEGEEPGPAASGAGSDSAPSAESRRMKLPPISSFRGFPNMAAVKLFTDIAAAARRVRLDQSQQRLRRRFITFMARIKLQATTLAQVAAQCCAELPDCADRDIPANLAATEASVHLCPNRPTAQKYFCDTFNKELKMSEPPAEPDSLDAEAEKQKDEDGKLPIEKRRIAAPGGAVELAAALGRKRRGYLDEHEARLAGSWRKYKERLDLRAAACAAACASVILVDLPLCQDWEMDFHRERVRRMLLRIPRSHAAYRGVLPSAGSDGEDAGDDTDWESIVRPGVGSDYRVPSRKHIGKRASAQEKKGAGKAAGGKPGKGAGVRMLLKHGDPQVDLKQLDKDGSPLPLPFAREWRRVMSGEVLSDLYRYLKLAERRAAAAVRATAASGAGADDEGPGAESEGESISDGEGLTGDESTTSVASVTSQAVMKVLEDAIKHRVHRLGAKARLAQAWYRKHRKQLDTSAGAMAELVAETIKDFDRALDRELDTLAARAAAAIKRITQRDAERQFLRALNRYLHDYDLGETASAPPDVKEPYAARATGSRSQSRRTSVASSAASGGAAGGASSQRRQSAIRVRY